MQITAKDLAALLGATLEGNPDATVSKLAKIEQADEQSFCFLANPKYYSYAQTAKAGILLCDETLEYNKANFGAVLRVKEPYAAFQQLMEMYAAMQNSAPRNGIHEKSFIHPGANVGSNCSVGAFAVLEENVRIGNNVTIHPNVVIEKNCVIGDNTIVYGNVTIYHDCTVGANCIIHSGAVIGSDGFGFAPQPDGSYKKIPQTGNVVIEDNVEIGANTCIDRAVIGSTILRKGVKLDNLIQVAHNVELGENTAIAAQAGISGSTRIGKNVMIGGQAGITGHLNIGNGVKVQAQAAVIKDVEDNKGISGAPAIDAREHYRQLAAIRQLPDLLKKVAQLQKQLEELKRG